ncbi:uncharacterized protein FIBRA_00084 [Fibroporia radiculosa]|uniref:Uncharacterized protein n=1 Tax=Fibroporia radiculosa TaxID=599839 RepID=J7RUU3_9APHY|nr:uncharacterized protein FIBRA_00084 [Fibroporia radiculosa]CCL98090.1 predicted protein [Fibroporia radiculosa]
MQVVSETSEVGRRRPTNWAALEALEELALPSPSPSLGTAGLSSLCSTGEIPILLDAGRDLTRLSDDLDSQIAECNQSPLSNKALGREYSSKAASSANALGLCLAVPKSSNHDVLFGSKDDTESLEKPLQGDNGYHKQSRLTVSRESSTSLSSPLVYEVPGPLSPSTSHRDSPVASPCVTPAWSTPTSPLTSPRSIYYMMSPSAADLRDSSSPSNLVKRDDSRSQQASISGPFSTLSMTLFGSGSLLSSSPSVCSTGTEPSPRKVGNNPWKWRQIYKSKSCSPMPRVNRLSPSASKNNVGSTPGSAPVTPLVPTFDLPETSHHSATASNSVRSLRSVRSGQISSPLASYSAAGAQPFNLPGILGWLRNTILELWIDQEGSPFAARPAFRLMGYTSEHAKGRDEELVNALTYGLADFLPVKRQVFVFKSDNLTAAPILRRVTTVGDEPKDCILQQALLTIDSDGVYSVGGIEFFDLQAHQAPLVLRWKLEYFVHDNIAEASEVLAQGEKAFTPLRFSCSPGLLHPSHGRKKTGLMQMFKRNQSVRLCAEKMAAPKFPESVLSTFDHRYEDGRGKDLTSTRPDESEFKY